MVYTIPAQYSNWQGGYAPSTAVPTPPNGYTPDPGQANATRFYGPANLRDPITGQPTIPRNQYFTDALDQGWIYRFPGELNSPELKPTAFFTGTSAKNLNWGNSNLTAAAWNGMSALCDDIDALAAHYEGISPIDPIDKYLYSPPGSGGLGNINGQIASIPPNLTQPNQQPQPNATAAPAEPKK